MRNSNPSSEHRGIDIIIQKPYLVVMLPSLPLTLSTQMTHAVVELGQSESWSRYSGLSKGLQTLHFVDGVQQPGETSNRRGDPLESSNNFERECPAERSVKFVASQLSH